MMLKRCVVRVIQDIKRTIKQFSNGKVQIK